MVEGKNGKTKKYWLDPDLNPGVCRIYAQVYSPAGFKALSGDIPLDQLSILLYLLWCEHGVGILAALRGVCFVFLSPDSLWCSNVIPPFLLILQQCEWYTMTRARKTRTRQAHSPTNPTTPLHPPSESPTSLLCIDKILPATTTTSAKGEVPCEAFRQLPGQVFCSRSAFSQLSCRYVLEYSMYCTERRENK